MVIDAQLAICETHSRSRTTPALPSARASTEASCVPHGGRPPGEPQPAGGSAHACGDVLRSGLLRLSHQGMKSSRLTASAPARCPGGPVAVDVRSLADADESSYLVVVHQRRRLVVEEPEVRAGPIRVVGMTRRYDF